MITSIFSFDRKENKILSFDKSISISYCVAATSTYKYNVNPNILLSYHYQTSIIMGYNESFV